MPEQTLNFAIPYPCSGETIDPQVFEDWTTAIDAAITEVDDAAEFALKRPRASMVTSTTGMSVPINVATTFTYSTTEYDSGLTASTAAGTMNPLTAAQSGIYRMTANISPTNTVTSVTSFKVWILSGTAIVAQRTLASQAAVTSAERMSVSGLGYLTFGTPATVLFHWTGTGGPMTVYCRFNVDYIAP